MSKSLVEQQFGPAARDYAECEVHRSGASLARLVGLTAPQPGWEALDIATGAGHTALAFAPHVARVVASDITEEMLAETARLAAGQHAGNVETARAEAEAMPFPDASFDLVSCRLAAHHFARIGAFVAEAARVLRPGGRLAVVDNIPPDAQSLPGAAAQDIAQAEADYHDFEKRRDPSHARALSADAWRRIYEEAGLQIVAEEILEKEMAFTPWVQRMRCAPETVSHLRAVLEGETLLARFLKPRRKDGDLQLTLRELILIGEKPAA